MALSSISRMRRRAHKLRPGPTPGGGHDNIGEGAARRRGRGRGASRALCPGTARSYSPGRHTTGRLAHDEAATHAGTDRGRVRDCGAGAGRDARGGPGRQSRSHAGAGDHGPAGVLRSGRILRLALVDGALQRLQFLDALAGGRNAARTGRGEAVRLEDGHPIPLHVARGHRIHQRAGAHLGGREVLVQPHPGTGQSQRPVERARTH